MCDAWVRIEQEDSSYELVFVLLHVLCRLCIRRHPLPRPLLRLLLSCHITNASFDSEPFLEDESDQPSADLRNENQSTYFAFFLVSLWLKTRSKMPLIAKVSLDCRGRAR